MSKKSKLLSVWRLGVLLPGVLLLDLILSGCAGPSNPSFNTTVREAYDDLHRMKQDPRPLDRPLILLSGWLDPGIATAHLRSEFRQMFADRDILAVSFAFDGSFDACRAKLIERVNEQFPSTDPSATVEVDVVAVSMGGLVARYASMPHPHDSEAAQLRTVRLFTISTPHQGARLAKLPTFNTLAKSMRPDSDFIQQLAADHALADYELHPYARLGDHVVGVANTAPAGRHPWWVPRRFPEPAHGLSFRDPRIVADIARRLRNEPPLTTDPAAPLP